MFMMLDFSTLSITIEFLHLLLKSDHDSRSDTLSFKSLPNTDFHVFIHYLSNFAALPMSQPNPQILLKSLHWQTNAPGTCSSSYMNPFREDDR